MSPAFAAAINDACARTGTLYIADEVQTGLGRTGYPFYSQALGLRPDLMSVGKALGGGVPIGAALVSERVAETISPGTTAAPTAATCWVHARPRSSSTS